MSKTSKSNIVKVVALGTVAYMVLQSFKKKNEGQKGFIGAPFQPSAPTPSTPIMPTPSILPMPSGYVVGRGQYSFTARSAYEDSLLKDFLGIYPTGADLDSYIARLDQAGLATWKNYWVGKFSEIGRNELVEFVQAKYRGRVFIAPIAQLPSDWQAIYEVKSGQNIGALLKTGITLEQIEGDARRLILGV